MSHPRRLPTDHHGAVPLAGLCPDCGKVRYRSRRDARQVAARVHSGQRMRAYRCGDYWHLTSQAGEVAAKWRGRPPADAPGALTGSPQTASQGRPGVIGWSAP